MRAVSAVGGALLLSGIFYPLALTWMAKFLTLSHSPERADLILVLGGDFWGPRALRGAELGAHGYGKKVMISGPPYRDQPESDLSIRFLVEKGYPPELFVSFPNFSKSTIDEALVVCQELNRLAAKKVLIVTSAYHSRRASIVYRLFCHEVRFLSVAAADSQFEVKNWWETPRYRKIFFSEWGKMIATVFWSYPKYSLESCWKR